MQSEIRYSRNERRGLIALAVLGVAGLNGAFFYGLLFQADALAEALTNPISAAFIVEVTILMIVLAYLLDRWNVSRLSPGWFIVLSLLGGIAFALPVVLLWQSRRSEDRCVPRRESPRGT